MEQVSAESRGAKGSADFECDDSANQVDLIVH